MSGSTGRMKLFHLNASAWAHQFHASTRNPGRPDAPFLVGFDLTGTAALGAVAQVPVFRQIHLNGAYNVDGANRAPPRCSILWLCRTFV